MTIVGLPKNSLVMTAIVNLSDMQLFTRTDWPPIDDNFKDSSQIINYYEVGGWKMDNIKDCWKNHDKEPFDGVLQKWWRMRQCFTVYTLVAQACQKDYRAEIGLLKKGDKIGDNPWIANLKWYYYNNGALHDVQFSKKSEGLTLHLGHVEVVDITGVSYPELYKKLIAAIEDSKWEDRLPDWFTSNWMQCLVDVAETFGIMDDETIALNVIMIGRNERMD